MHRWLRAICAIALILLYGCSSVTSSVPPNTIVLTGRINPLLGPTGAPQCWVLEVGSDLRSLKYYALDGPENLLGQLQQEDARVTLRVVVRMDAHPDCPVGSVAYVYEIISLSTPRD